MLKNVIKNKVIELIINIQTSMKNLTCPKIIFVIDIIN